MPSWFLQALLLTVASGFSRVARADSITSIDWNDPDEAIRVAVGGKALLCCQPLVEPRIANPRIVALSAEHRGSDEYPLILTIVHGLAPGRTRISFRRRDELRTLLIDVVRGFRSTPIKGLLGHAGLHAVDHPDCVEVILVREQANPLVDPIYVPIVKEEVMGFEVTEKRPVVDGASIEKLTDLLLNERTYLSITDEPYPPPLSANYGFRFSRGHERLTVLLYYSQIFVQSESGSEKSTPRGLYLDPDTVPTWKQILEKAMPKTRAEAAEQTQPARNRSDGSSSR